MPVTNTPYGWVVDGSCGVGSAAARSNADIFLPVTSASEAFLGLRS